MPFYIFKTFTFSKKVEVSEKFQLFTKKLFTTPDSTSKKKHVYGSDFFYFLPEQWTTCAKCQENLTQKLCFFCSKYCFFILFLFQSYFQFDKEWENDIKIQMKQVNYNNRNKKWKYCSLKDTNHKRY